MRRLVGITTLAAVLAVASSAGAELAPPSPAPAPVKRTCSAYEVVKHEGGAPTARCVKYEWTGPPSTPSRIEPLSGTDRINPKLFTPGDSSGTAGSRRAAHRAKHAFAKRDAARGGGSGATSTSGMPSKGGPTTAGATRIAAPGRASQKNAATARNPGTGNPVALVASLIVASSLAGLALLTLIRKRRIRSRAVRLRRSPS
jgi:hypothetical protein